MAKSKGKAERRAERPDAPITTDPLRPSAAVMEVIWAEAARSLTSDGPDHTIEFDWAALGYERVLNLELGGKVVAIHLPDRFPEKPLRVDELDVEVAGVTHTFALRSVPHRVVSHVSLTLSTVDVSTAFALRAGATLLLGAWLHELGGVTLLDRTDEYEEYGIRPANDHERTVVRGGPCRPDCRWVSLLSTKRVHHWQLERTEIFPGHIVQHYTRHVMDTWVGWHCEDRAWTWRHAHNDRYVERQRIRTKHK